MPLPPLVLSCPQRHASMSMCLSVFRLGVVRVKTASCGSLAMETVVGRDQPSPQQRRQAATTTHQQWLPWFTVGNRLSVGVVFIMLIRPDMMLPAHNSGLRRQCATPQGGHSMMGERERRERASPPIFSVESRVQATTTGRRGDVHGLDNGCSRRVVLPVLPARAPGDVGRSRCKSSVLKRSNFVMPEIVIIMRMNVIIHHQTTHVFLSQLFA